MNLNNKRIAANTIMLYLRQILIMLIGLYSVRIVLKELGVEDYGIYNVIGGVVGLFIFVSGTMASATQRFFSFSIGQSDLLNLKKIFSVNLIVYLCLAIFVYFLLETIGSWFVAEKLIIPQNREISALYVYHLSCFSFIFTFVTSPFIAILIAHEDMKTYAYLSIIEALFKLGCVLLLNIEFEDKLVVYSVFLVIISVLNLFLYIIVCCRKYEECQFLRFYWDKALFSSILNYTGWTMFGQITSVARTQAITVLVNQVFNPAIVAARAIANSVSIYMSTFSTNFNTGLYPPIIKTYASGQFDSMYKLIYTGSKFTFFLMWIFSLPMILKSEYILDLWLAEVPEYAVLFTQLAIIEVLINSVSMPLMTAARAPGRMKLYELSLGIIQILLFLFVWIFLQIGFGPSSVYWIAIVANIIMFIVRVLIVHKLIGLSIIAFFKEVCFPMSFVVLASTIISAILHRQFSDSFIYVFIFCVFSVFSTTFCMFLFGLTSSEREKLKVMIKSKLKI